MLKPKHFPNFKAYLEGIMRRHTQSPADIARRMGVPQSTITRWLSGSVPHRATLAKLEAAYGPPRAEDMILQIPDAPSGRNVMQEEAFTYPNPNPRQAAADAVIKLADLMTVDQLMQAIESLSADRSPENIAASRHLITILRTRLKSPANPPP